MEFKTHLQVLRMCRTQNITKGALIRQIYTLIKDHEGKDFKDLDDLFKKLYPRLVVKHLPAGVQAFYNTEVQDLEKEAQE